MYKDYQIFVTARSSRSIRELIRPLDLYIKIHEYKKFKDFLKQPSLALDFHQGIGEQVAYNELKFLIPEIPALEQLQQPFICLTPDMPNKYPIFVPKQNFNEQPLFYINRCLKEFGTVYCRKQLHPRFEASDIIIKTSAI